MKNDDDIPKERKWEPAIGIRISRVEGVDTLQQMYWRRSIDGVTFEREWRDVPIVKGEKASPDQS